LINQVLDIAYAYRTPYHLKTVYTITVISFAARFVLSIGLGQYYYHKYVRNYRPSGLGSKQEEKVIEMDNDDEEAEMEAEKGKSMSRRDA
jgi:hypothetical protein